MDCHLMSSSKGYEMVCDLSSISEFSLSLLQKAQQQRQSLRPFPQDPCQGIYHSFHTGGF